MRLLPAVFAGFMGLFSVTGYAFHASDFQWDRFSDDFVMDKDTFHGDWKNSETWKGLICNGKFDATATLKGRVGDVDFKLNEDESLSATADLRDIVADLSGDYRSEISACLALPFEHEISVDRIDVAAHVTFTDKGANVPPDLHIQVLSTTLGKVTYAQWLPAWFQDFMTNKLNEGLKLVWSTSLGERINDYISEQIAKSIPHKIK